MTVREAMFKVIVETQELRNAELSCIGLFNPFKLNYDTLQAALDFNDESVVGMKEYANEEVAEVRAYMNLCGQEGYTFIYVLKSGLQLLLVRAGDFHELNPIKGVAFEKEVDVKGKKVDLRSIVYEARLAEKNGSVSITKAEDITIKKIQDYLRYCTNLEQMKELLERGLVNDDFCNERLRVLIGGYEIGKREIYEYIDRVEKDNNVPKELCEKWRAMVKEIDVDEAEEEYGTKDYDYGDW